MKYKYWFAAMSGISNSKKRELRMHFSDAKEIYNIEEKQLNTLGVLNTKEIRAFVQSKKGVWEKEFEEMMLKGIRLVDFCDQQYPEKLKQIDNPPYALYIKGKLPDPLKKTVAIVGARNCSTYGELMALEYGQTLSKYGIQIVSGMARGIDGAGHRGALQGGSESFAVLGCGVDVCYPKENQGLYKDLVTQGGVISELPPGVQPKPCYFPMRNRLISGLSDYILILEAREKSGSLITADFALEQGKEIFALPGAANSPLSRGCHLLIKQGAGILLSPEELIEEMNISYVLENQNPDKNKKMLETINDMVYSCVGLSPKNTQELQKETKLPIQKLLVSLTELELEGMIQEISKNQYVRTKI